MKDEFRRLEETNVWNRVVMFLFTVKKQKKKSTNYVQRIHY